MANALKLDEADDQFLSGAREWLALLDASKLISFSQVLEGSPGYYPSTLYACWLAELEARELTPLDSSWPSAFPSSFLVSHPLDYDWRFTQASVNDLVYRIDAGTRAGDTIAYLGTPTLYARSVEQLGARRHILVDSNHSVVEAVRALYGQGAAIELTLGREQLPEDLVATFFVLDPPWYLDASLDFLSSAASRARRESTVLVSQPSIGTRPGVQAERDQLVLEAANLGLVLESIEPRAVGYVMPHFERMALATELPDIAVPANWRKGDLLTFTVGSDAPGNRSRNHVAPLETWTEAAFGPVRIKLRAAGANDLEPISQGVDRLPNVSRRDPLRSRVGFWTSGNRVRTASDVSTIVSVIQACDDDLRDVSFTHTRTMSHAEQLGLAPNAAEQLFEILLLELQEHLRSGTGDAG